MWRDQSDDYFWPKTRTTKNFWLYDSSMIDTIKLTFKSHYFDSKIFVKILKKTLPVIDHDDLMMVMQMMYVNWANLDQLNDDDDDVDDVNDDADDGDDVNYYDDDDDDEN